ncbi:hypothetical protein Hanom_Chr16g01431721 [Helianthus anomalus]
MDLGEWALNCRVTVSSKTIIGVTSLDYDVLHLAWTGFGKAGSTLRYSMTHMAHGI